MNKERLIIYQMFPRILTNNNENCVRYGTLEENGSGKFNDITAKVIKSIKELGVNTIWLTGVIEMATKTGYPGIPADNPNVVKGQAGSPYAIKDYYDVAPSLAVDLNKRMEEFEKLVKRIKLQGMKAIIDFVPNHTARRYHSDTAPIGVRDFGANDDISMFFHKNNNYYYITNQQFSPDFDLGAEGDVPYVEFPAKATGNNCFTAFCTRNDWYETVKLNYGYDPAARRGDYNPAPDTWVKMLNILRFWASKGIDGFRCDMVFMVPKEFWHWAIPQVKKDYPDIIFIGEIYDVGEYRPFIDYCHFDYLYDKVNLYDTLVGIERYNKSAAQLTGCWQTVEGIGDRMLNFLENHDEVRFASKEFGGDPARVVPHLVVSALMTSGPFMIYYGQELGENGSDNEGFAGDNNRSTIFDYWSYATMRRWYNSGKVDGKKITAHERWLRTLYQKVLTLCNDNAAFREGSFFDLMYVNLQNPDFNPHHIYAFVRYSDEKAYLVVANFGNNEETVKVEIPDLCYKMAGLKEGDYLEADLLWNHSVSYGIHRGEKTAVKVSGHDALILPIDVLSR